MKGVEICKLMKIGVLSVWPGSDGADYHFQIDYKQSIEWFTEALVAATYYLVGAAISAGYYRLGMVRGTVYVLAALSSFTVAQRIFHVRRELMRPEAV